MHGAAGRAAGPPQTCIPVKQRGGAFTGCNRSSSMLVSTVEQGQGLGDRTAAGQAGSPVRLVLVGVPCHVVLIVHKYAFILHHQLLLTRIA